MIKESLSKPASYFPFAGGVYEITAGLRPFGTDFGNGDADRRAFQIDQAFARFRGNKLACHAERPGKYVVRHDLDEVTERALATWLIDRLTAEHPRLFVVTSEDDGCRIECHHTGDRIA